MSGGSRGVGLEIAKTLGKDGANVIILAKTTEPHPTLPGTIYTAAEEIEAVGGNALPVVCDIRFEEQVAQAVTQGVEKFGLPFPKNLVGALRRHDPAVAEGPARRSELRRI